MLTNVGRGTVSDICIYVEMIYNAAIREFSVARVQQNDQLTICHCYLCTT